MDAYIEVLRLQHDAKLAELRREAEQYRLVRSLASGHRSFKELARMLVRRPRPVGEQAVAAVRPLASAASVSDVDSLALQKRAS